MSIFLLPLAVLCLVGIRFSGKDFRADYCAPRATACVNGVFTVLVLMHHVITSGAYNGGGLLDEIFSRYIHLSQLIVVPFLFFSGYGIAESIKNKPGYLKKMPKNRLLTTWLHLVLALVPYFMMNLCFGEEMTVWQVLLSTIGWDSLGNSNWFMFVIFALYMLVMLGYAVCREKPVPSTILTTVLTCGLTVALIAAGKESHWWNTAIFFPLGIWFSLLRPAIEKIIQKNNIVYWVCFALSAVLFAGTHFLFCKTNKVIVFMADGAFMMAFILIGLMKFKIENAVLFWLGKNLFGIYILQRLPMRFIEHFGWQINPYIYTLLIFAIALLLAFVFGKLTGIIDRKLLKKGAAKAGK